MCPSSANIAYYSSSLQGSLSMAALQRECGGTFVTNRASTLKHFRKLYPDVATVRRYRYLQGLGGHRLLKHADIIFSGAGYQAYLAQFQAKKIMVFHGVLCISEDLLSRLRHFDHFFLIGPYVEQQILRHSRTYNVSYSITGYLPFALFPEKNEDTRRTFLQKLSLNPNRKTIVYTPSKASVGTWLSCRENIAQEIPSEFNLIMRPHPNQALSPKKTDRSSFARINRLLSRRPNSIIDLSTCALPELLCVADLMITDANATALESLFYDCPQLFADTNRSGRVDFKQRFDELAMHPDDTREYLNIFNCGPSFYADGFKNWGNAVEYALENEGQYKELRSRHFFYIFKAKDRDAAKRIHSELAAIIPQRGLRPEPKGL